MSSDADSVLIVGLGNELLGDEGLGVHVARSLLAARDSLPAHVTVLEAGTSLLDVLPEMPRYARVILVDAVRTGRRPGTLCRAELSADSITQQEASAPVSLHQWGVMETLRAAKLLKLLPARLSLVGAEPERIGPGTELSPALARARERITSILLDELR
jgi:hydrogenase maturation protease